MTLVKMRSDLIEEGYDSIPCWDWNINEEVSASDVESSKFIDCSDDGEVALQLRDGRIVTVYSIDLEYTTL